MNTPTKRCSKCDQELPATSQFFYEKNKGTGKLTTMCKKCQLLNLREARKRNPQKHRDYSTQWNRNNPERYNERMRTWKEKNPERSREIKNQYRQRNKDKINARNRAYKKTQRGRVNYQANTEKRLAIKRNLPNKFNGNNWQHALNYFNGCCAVCGRPAGLWHKIAMDHWIPISNPDCPGTVPTNIVPLCHAAKDGEACCNNSKANKLPDQWLVEKFGKHKAKKILERIQKYFDSLKD